MRDEGRAVRQTGIRCVGLEAIIHYLLANSGHFDQISLLRMLSCLIEERDLLEFATQIRALIRGGAVCSNRSWLSRILK